MGVDHFCRFFGGFLGLTKKKKKNKQRGVFDQKAGQGEKGAGYSGVFARLLGGVCGAELVSSGVWLLIDLAALVFALVCLVSLVDCCSFDFWGWFIR